jgi:SAM-dependent methyltransferase
MYAEAARFYDVIHAATGRDPDAEADLVMGELRRRHPGPRSLLDVACGSGSNLSRFGEFCDVAGVDASAEMLALAGRRCPGVPLFHGDMRDFDLGRRFDAVVCLFSSIGYLTQPDDLAKAIVTMASHLDAGGVLMIEGWVEPEYWRGTTFNSASGTRSDLAVARVTRSHREGPLCHVSMRYTAASSEGVSTVDEDHVVRLSDPHEFEEAYRAAGLSFERLAHMLHPGRAVYVGASNP